MSATFISSLAAVALLGLAAFALLSKGAAPLLPQLAKLGPWVHAAGARVRRLWRRLWLMKSEAWAARYAKPWVLIVGQRGAGKSAWLATAKRLGLAQDGPGPAAPGPVPHTEVLALRQGVLFDPDGAAWGDAASRRAVLNALSDERPERALDAVVLVVRADSLVGNEADAGRQLGIEASHHLEAVRRELGLLLPVYVVLTHGDRLDGYEAFWAGLAPSAAAAQQQQMFGWSAPSGLETGELRELVDQAFDAMAQELTELQVDAARSPAQIARADEFFLFPQRLNALREPLRAYLAGALREEAWQGAFACRGLYFCGPLDDGAQPSTQPKPPPKTPRDDLAFVGDVLFSKLLAERGLARVTRPALWSRDRVVRALQFGMAAGVAALAIGVGLGSLRLSKHVEQAIAGAERLAVPSAGPLQGACLNAAAVSTALQQLGALEGSTRSVWMPWSWLAPAPDGALLQRVNQRVLAPTVLPALACQLHQRLKQLDSAVSVVDEAARRQALLAQAERAATLDRQLADYQRVIGVTEGAEAKRDAMARLLQGVLGLGAPSSSLADLLGRALAAEPGVANAALVRALPASLPPRAIDALADLPDAWRQALEDEITSGPQRLARLEATTPRPAKPVGRNVPIVRESLQASTHSLATWLGWLQNAWLPFNAERNPCSLAAAELGGHFERLRLAPSDRTRLSNALQRLAQPEQCFNPLRALIEPMKLGRTQMPLVSDAGSAKARLNPQWQAELRGLRSLLEQAFMQPEGEATIACQAGAVGWNATALDTALRHARDYLSYSAAQGLPPLGSNDAQRPLFDQLARSQLERAMNGALLGAQLGAPFAAPSSPPPVDDNLPQLSTEFAQALKSLLPLQQLYGQLRFNASAAELTQCSRALAQRALQRINDLASASKLYVPGPGSDGALVNIGPTPVARAYLAQQLERAATLAGYSQPFVTLLNSSRAVNDGAASSAGGAGGPGFWANTAQELQRYVDAKDSSGAVGQLEALFLNQLATLTTDNCAARLGATPAAALPAGSGTSASVGAGATASASATTAASSLVPVATTVPTGASATLGTDLFTQRAAALKTQVRLSCTANAYANYLALANRFNSQLAGRYPFADVRRPDVPLADAKAFFLDYAAIAQPLQASLAASNDARTTTALAFLKQLDAAAAFLRSSLSAGDLSQPLTLTPSFRAQLQSSQGAEQLLSWTFISGTRVIEFPGPAGASLSWPFGQALSLDLTWPDGSVGGGAAAVWRPAAPAAGASYQLRGSTATFSFGGDWALLRLIESQRPSSGPTTDSLDPARLLLEFKVATQRTAAGALQPSAAEARVYLGLKLSAVDPKTTVATTVVWPGRLVRSAPTQ